MINRIFLLALACAFGFSVAVADEPAATPKPAVKTSTKSSKATHKASKPAEVIKRGVSIDQLQGSRLSAAIGHYSRARHLLISAVNEFDAGLKIANPDILMNSDAWRKAVLEQASELDRVLAPQPAQPTGGIKYPGDSRLLTETNR